MPKADKLQTVTHGSALAFCSYFCYYDQHINRIHVQGTSFALSRVEGASHKPFGFESFDPELTTEGLRAERFTPIPGVHKCIKSDRYSASAP